MRNLKFSGNYFDQYITLKQISKIKARKLFCAGETIYLQSSNFHPFGVWSNAISITLDTEELKSDQDHYNWCKSNNYDCLELYKDAAGQFTMRCNNFSYYNCDNERGRYITFYEKI